MIVVMIRPYQITIIIWILVYIYQLRVYSQLIIGDTIQFKPIDERKLIVASPKNGWIALVYIDRQFINLIHLSPFIGIRPSPTGKYIGILEYPEKLGDPILYLWIPSKNKIIKLGKCWNFSWSPSEKFLAVFQREYVSWSWGMRLVLWDIQKKKKKRLGFLFSDEAVGLSPQWSPDGKKIAVRGRPWAPNMIPDASKQGLYILNTITGKVIEVEKEGVSGEFLLWSNDSERLYYMQFLSRAIFEYNLKTQNKVKIGYIYEELDKMKYFSSASSSQGVLFGYRSKERGKVLWFDLQSRQIKELINLEKNLIHKDWVPCWFGRIFALFIKDELSKFWCFIKPKIIQGQVYLEETLIDSNIFSSWLKARIKK